MDATNKPKVVNDVHFSTGEFPKIIAFCERDETTHIVKTDEEVYQYKLHDKIVYMLKRKEQGWELVEFDSNTILRVNSDVHLETVLMRALTFREADRANQETRTNILFPINKLDSERVMAIMYYLGGYPRSFFPVSPEFTFIKDTFIDPELEFLSYSYVPTEYVPWLREELKNGEFIGQDKNRTIWMYKK